MRPFIFTLRKQLFYSIDFLDKLVLGQRQLSLRDPVISFSGRLTDFYVWADELSRDEMSAWTGCRGGPNVIAELQGKSTVVLDWREQRWEHRNVRVSGAFITYVIIFNCMRTRSSFMC